MPNRDSDKVLVELAEWQRLGPEDDARLRSVSLRDQPDAQRIAAHLRRCVDIRPGYEGCEIETTSFVGRVDVGPLRLSITPKLPSMPLTVLLRYAYGLRDLKNVENTSTPIAKFALHDLLIAMLRAELEDLIVRGLVKRYVPFVAHLEMPRGRLLVSELARRGGIREARLPCQYFERDPNWTLNRVLRGGLRLGASMATDRDLRMGVMRLDGAFDAVEASARIAPEELKRAKSLVTRLTTAYEPALNLIELLSEMHGMTFDDSDRESAVPGFLFDMNVFFQRLLSRFLREHLITGSFDDEFPIRNMFVFVPPTRIRRKDLEPRPDYALFDGREPTLFLDANYRDIWQLSCSADWLYQAAIYALSLRARRSVLLYATMSPEAHDQVMEIRDPLNRPGSQTAVVVLRPVLLEHLAELLRPGKGRASTDERREYAAHLISPGAESRVSRALRSGWRVAGLRAPGVMANTAFL